MNKFTLNDLNNVTMTITETFQSTVPPNIELCEEFAIDRKTSLIIYFIISFILFYIIISLTVYAFKNKFLFKCDGTYEDTGVKFI